MIIIGHESPERMDAPRDVVTKEIQEAAQQMTLPVTLNDKIETPATQLSKTGVRVPHMPRKSKKGLEKAPNKSAANDCKELITSENLNWCPQRDSPSAPRPQSASGCRPGSFATAKAVPAQSATFAFPPHPATEQLRCRKRDSCLAFPLQGTKRMRVSPSHDPKFCSITFSFLELTHACA